MSELSLGVDRVVRELTPEALCRLPELLQGIVFHADTLTAGKAHLCAAKSTTAPLQDGKPE
ncbi:hypothetical protein BFW01_g12792 [Lasiodiplodia theobromae]|nr:hypothetical protein BFW01_g12792 [Lasiodiplodia theobromae]